MVKCDPRLDALEPHAAGVATGLSCGVDERVRGVGDAGMVLTHMPMRSRLQTAPGDKGGRRPRGDSRLAKIVELFILQEQRAELYFYNPRIGETRRRVPECCVYYYYLINPHRAATLFTFPLPSSRHAASREEESSSSPSHPPYKINMPRSLQLTSAWGL